MFNRFKVDYKQYEKLEADMARKMAALKPAAAKEKRGPARPLGLAHQVPELTQALELRTGD